MNDEARGRDLQTLARQWLDKANEDLTMADLLLSAPTAAKWGACFHAQQAAEKAMKAVLVLRDRDVPHTHSLVLLRATLGEDGQLLDGDALKQLSPWAVAGRYPEEIPEPSPVEAEALVAIGHAVVAFARRVAHGDPGR